MFRLHSSVIKASVKKSHKNTIKVVRMTLIQVFWSHIIVLCGEKTNLSHYWILLWCFFLCHFGSPFILCTEKCSLFLWSTQRIKSYGFGTTWRWEKGSRILFLCELAPQRLISPSRQCPLMIVILNRNLSCISCILKIVIAREN